MVQVSDVKFGMLLGFAKADQKVGVTLGYGSFPKFAVPLNISVMAEAIDFKFGIELSFCQVELQRYTKRQKMLTTVVWELAKIKGSFNIFVMAETIDF